MSCCFAMSAAEIVEHDHGFVLRQQEIDHDAADVTCAASYQDCHKKRNSTTTLESQSDRSIYHAFITTGRASVKNSFVIS